MEFKQELLKTIRSAKKSKNNDQLEQIIERSKIDNKLTKFFLDIIIEQDRRYINVNDKLTELERNIKR